MAFDPASVAAAAQAGAARLAALSVVNQVAGILEAAAVIFTAGITAWTINDWRKENLGKRKLEVAEQTLLAFYDLKQRVHDVRRPLDAPVGLDPVAAFEVNRSRYWNRLGWLGGMPAEDNSLPAIRSVFQVYFGPENAAPFGRMIAAVGIVRGALDEIFTNVPANNHTLAPKSELLDILGWGAASRPDHTDSAIAAAVMEMEAICKPVLEGKR